MCIIKTPAFIGVGRKTFITDAKLVNAFEINVRDFYHLL
jgi:hypothetical protein